MKIQLNKSTLYRVIRFAIVGVLNTLLDLAVLNLLVFIFNVTDPIIFSLCKGFSFIVALTNSYFMNKYFTFVHKKKSSKEFYLFVFVSLIGMLINIAISGLSFYLLGLSNYHISPNIVATISGIIGALFSMVTNYLGYHFFVFK